MVLAFSDTRFRGFGSGRAFGFEGCSGPSCVISNSDLSLAGESGMEHDGDNVPLLITGELMTIREKVVLQGGRAVQVESVRSLIVCAAIPDDYHW